MNGKDAKTSSLPQPRSHIRKTTRIKEEILEEAKDTGQESSARPDEAEEGQNSDQKCLADQDLHQDTTVALEVIFDHGVDFAQLFSDHLEGRR